MNKIKASCFATSSNNQQIMSLPRKLNNISLPLPRDGTESQFSEQYRYTFNGDLFLHIDSNLVTGRFLIFTTQLIYCLLRSKSVASYNNLSRYYYRYAEILGRKQS
ncbi:hypothetical protein RF11_12726 [Thelohanellus kitauei]|uniref:Uncharacterized protein n=1 Tax=Thelohanellus kitauei TaxID=669202 RepID=A0A0C2MX86_THEKT|nr:hypothetical protein RF11_12726 [Thelohanellus kitauei]